jgi:hypothetical protein
VVLRTCSPSNALSHPLRQHKEIEPAACFIIFLTAAAGAAACIHDRLKRKGSHRNHGPSGEEPRGEEGAEVLRCADVHCLLLIKSQDSRSLGLKIAKACEIGAEKPSF